MTVPINSYPDKTVTDSNRILAVRVSPDLIRGIRLHTTKLLKGLQTDDLRTAQLGLGHSYSRSKLKFNVNRVDNMIIQAIFLLDQLDKDVNLFSMRIRGWYGYRFPELVSPGTRQPPVHSSGEIHRRQGDSKLPDPAAILNDDSTIAQNILDAARGSMGSALSEIDLMKSTPLPREWYPYQTTSSRWFRIYSRSRTPSPQLDCSPRRARWCPIDHPRW
jgi:RNA processing factor Prp31